VMGCESTMGVSVMKAAYGVPQKHGTEFSPCKSVSSTDLLSCES
jgi:hypothetical protein